MDTKELDNEDTHLVVSTSLFLKATKEMVSATHVGTMPQHLLEDLHDNDDTRHSAEKVSGRIHLGVPWRNALEHTRLVKECEEAKARDLEWKNEMKAEAKGRDQDWKHKMGEILFLVEEMRKERKRDEDRRDGARNGWLRRRKCC